MTLVEMAEAPASLRSWLSKARRGPVVATVNGRPVVALTPIRDGDWERLVVASHPAFLRLLAESRKRCQPGLGILTEELRRRLKRRRAAVRGGAAAKRRAPRPSRRSGR